MQTHLISPQKRLKNRPVRLLRVRLPEFSRKIYIAFIAAILGVLLPPSFLISAQPLESTNFEIVDSEVGSIGEISDSVSYSLMATFDPIADPWFEGTSYALKSGFPNGILANVPKISCFETTTNAGTTVCNYLPHSRGMVGECGVVGCYDRAKIEIDDQDNPVDTLYLVAVSSDDFVTTYYLQSDHSIDTSYDINDFMTQCGLEGRDDDNTDCNDPTDGGWDEDLQSANISGLNQNTAYKVKVSALHGDFTGSAYSQTSTATTAVPSLEMDVDIAATNTESAAPYEINMGEMNVGTVNTATSYIWIDLATNWASGVTAYASDSNDGLRSSSTGGLIPSETEDLLADTNGTGGYGLRVESVSSVVLGPLLRNAIYYNAGLSHKVGAVDSTPPATRLIYTESAGSNIGPLYQGRAKLSVKTRPIAVDPSASDYTDDITIVANLNP